MTTLRVRLPRVDGFSVMAPALAVAVVLGYALYVGVARLLPPERFAVFAAFWGLSFGAAGVVAAVEQETARRVARADALGQRRAGAQRRMLGSGLLLAVLLVALGTLAWPLALGRALDRSLPLGLLAAVGVLGVAVQYTARGAYLGAARTRTYAGLVVAEAGLRALALLALLAVGQDGLLACAAAVVCGSFAWLLLGRRVLPAAADHGAPATPPWRDTLLRTSSLAVAAACTSAVITGFPVLAGAFSEPGQAERVGVALAALTLTRLPLLLLAPVQALLVPQMVRLLAAGGWRGTAGFVHRVWVSLAAGGGLAVLAQYLVGAPAVALIYGPAYRISGLVLAVMTSGAVVLAVLVVVVAALIALDQHGSVTVSWTVCLLVLVAVLAAPGEDLVARMAEALVVGPLAGLAVAAAALTRVTRRPGHDGPIVADGGQGPVAPAAGRPPADGGALS